MSGIGGYVPRKERRYIPPAPDDRILRCGKCRARLDVIPDRDWPHMCEQLTYGTAPSLPPPVPLEVPRDHALGGFLAKLLGADETADGPPYTHTFGLPELPEPIGYDEDGDEVYPPVPPVPSFSMTGPGVAEPEPDPDDGFCPACDESLESLPAGHLWGVSSGTGDWVCTSTGLTRTG